MKAFLCAVGAAVAASPALATVFTDLASFQAQLQPGAFTNAFNDAVAGGSPDLSYSQGGFSYTVSAGDAFGGVGTGTGLFNDPGLISTNNATDGIRITFTSGNVTAVGGNFWATDILVLPITATVTVTLSDGQTSSFTSAGPTSFRGFTSNVAISSLFIDADDSAAFAWSTLDNLIVGAAVPAPGAMALLGLGGLAAARRRR